MAFAIFSENLIRRLIKTRTAVQFVPVGPGFNIVCTNIFVIEDVAAFWQL